MNYPQGKSYNKVTNEIDRILKRGNFASQSAPQIEEDSESELSEEEYQKTLAMGRTDEDIKLL